MGGSCAGEIRLYDGIGQAWFDVECVRDYLLTWLPTLEARIRPDLPADGLGRVSGDGREAARADLAGRLCRCRVINPHQAPCPRRLLKPEMDYETRVVEGRTRATAGVVYDGNELQRIAFGCLARAERDPEAVHIWFTERLFATWHEDDRRYHARASVYGHPSIISASGMVHAPARGRQHYLARRLGMSPSSGAEPGGEDFLRHEDPRTTEMAKGYAMQAVFHVLFGEPFCDAPTCRLFNAHWQSEMLAAQLGEPEYCSRHEQMIRGWSGAAGTEKGQEFDD